jgi:hypothetical protein
MDPATVFAEWELGRIPGEKLSLIASALLAEGFSVPAFRYLAQIPITSRENGRRARLFTTGMQELGLERPSCQEAALLLARNTARALDEGKLSARDACADIAALTCSCSNPPEALADFYALLEEWELAAERGSEDVVNARIRLAAQKLLESAEATA